MTDRNIDASKAHGEQILASHLNVGRAKSVSYLPIKTIENVVGIKIAVYEEMILNSGNQCIVFSVDECCIDSGAVYAYSEVELKKILDDNSEILLRHGWPIAPVAFIRRISSEWLPPEDPIMPIIRAVFGDEH